MAGSSNKEKTVPVKKYKVTLTEEERDELTQFVNVGKGQAARLRRGRILLMADEAQPEGGWKDADIAKALGAHVRTVERIRQQCVEAGIEATINHARPRRSRTRKLDGAAEAVLSQIACTQAPDGHQRWTIQMLRDELIEMEVVESVGWETVRTTLKKTTLSLG